MLDLSTMQYQRQSRTHWQHQSNYWHVYVCVHCVLTPAVWQITMVQSKAKHNKNRRPESQKSIYTDESQSSTDEKCATTAAAKKSKTLIIASCILLPLTQSVMNNTVHTHTHTHARTNHLSVGWTNGGRMLAGLSGCVCSTLLTRSYPHRHRRTQALFPLHDWARKNDAETHTRLLANQPSVWSWRFPGVCCQ